MKVFISWSGERGKLIGEAFRTWLPDVIQSVNAFYSPDIEKGQRWSAEIEQNLKECKVGIICVTPESMISPWLMFESGAISNANLSRVCPLLFDVNAGQLQGPLSQFQATPYSEEEIRKLVTSINAFSQPPLTENQLHRTFDRCWPELKQAVEEALAKKPQTEELTKRTLEELVEETLATVRTLANTKPDEETINHWIVVFRSLMDFGHNIERLASTKSNNQLSDMAAATLNHLRLVLNLASPKITRSAKYKDLQAEAQGLMKKLESTIAVIDLI